MTGTSEPIVLPRQTAWVPLIAVVIVNYFAIIFTRNPRFVSSSILGVLFALVIAETALYAVWISIAPVALRWRVASVPVFVGFLMAFGIASEALIAECFWIWLWMCCLAIFGYRLVKDGEPVAEPLPWQFDLRRLLIFVTVAAVTLGIAVNQSIPTSQAFGHLVAGGMLALFTLPVVLALLITTRVRLWGWLALGLALWLGVYAEAVRAPQGLALVIVLLALVVESVALLYVRYCGYRLSRSAG